MSDAPDTIPAPPPGSWFPRAAQRRMTTVILAAVLGTGGAGAALTGLGQVVTAIRTSDTATAARLDRIEGKLDAWRDELAQAKAASDAATREAERLDSNVRALRAEVASYAPRR